jgi:glycine cleavage system aminomethyltransferase T
VQAEQKATREAVALYDQTSFSKLLLQGRDALAVLQRLCANEMDVPVGRMVYTPMLNARGGIESDLTVMRQAADRFLLVTGSAQADARRRLDRPPHPGGRARRADRRLADAQRAVGHGPEGARVAGAREPGRPVAEALKFSWTREIDLGHARVRAARMSYVGGPGFELYVPVEMARHVYLALHEAGADLGLKDAGYYALDALRIEQGRRAWGAELGPDETPWQAGLAFSVRLDKPSAFIGRDALLAARAAAAQEAGHAGGRRWRLAWGGETILVDGLPAGEITSAGYSPLAGGCVALGYVRGPAAQVAHAGTAAASSCGESRSACACSTSGRRARDG